MHAPPLEVVADQIEYVLLGGYPLKWCDEHMKMRMCDYFTGKWHDDVRKDWADFGTGPVVRRNSRRKRQRQSTQDRARE